MVTAAKARAASPARASEPTSASASSPFGTRWPVNGGQQRSGLGPWIAARVERAEGERHRIAKEPQRLGRLSGIEERGAAGPFPLGDGDEVSARSHCRIGGLGARRRAVEHLRSGERRGVPERMKRLRSTRGQQDCAFRAPAGAFSLPSRRGSSWQRSHGAYGSCRP